MKAKLRGWIRGAAAPRIPLVVLLAVLVPVPSAAAQSMAVQPDGKILLAGSTPFGLSYVARLLPNGRPDTGFGTEGVVVDPHGGGIIDLALQPDGSILALGERGSVARYRADGGLDTGFGADGYAALSAINHPAHLAILPSGRILVAGSAVLKFINEATVATLSPDGKTREWISGAGIGTSLNGLLVRDDGSLVTTLGLDGSFRRAGLARFVPGAGDYGSDFGIVVQSVAARPGYDKSFGGGSGLVHVKLAGDPPPRFLLGSLVADGEGMVALGSSEGSLIAAGFDGDGLLDQSFGEGGFASFAGGPRMVAAARDAAVSGGRILVAGDLHRRTHRYCDACRIPLLARLLPDGRLDRSFGGNGIAHLPGVRGPRRGARGEEVAISPNGGILFAGLADERRERAVVGRFRPDGSPDRSFGAGGVLQFRPCAGSRARQRRIGRLPSARAELSLRRTPGGPALQLEVEPRGDWATIRTLRVTPPRSVQVREGRAALAVFTYVDDHGGRQREPAELQGRSLVFKRHLPTGTKSLSLHIPSGALHWEQAPRSTDPFQVTVGFRFVYEKVGEQTLAVPLPG